MLLTTLELSKAQFKNVHFCNSGIVFPQGNRLTLKGEPGFSYVQTNAVKIISSACTLIVFLRCTHTVTAGLLEKRCVAYKKPGIIKIFISMMPGLYFPTLSDRCHISVFFVAYCFMTTHQQQHRFFMLGAQRRVKREEGREAVRLRRDLEPRGRTGTGAGTVFAKGSLV